MQTSSQSYEKSRQQVLQDVRAFDTAASDIEEELCAQLDDGFESPDDLFEFLRWFTKAHEIHLEADSILGVFARKMALSFEWLPFERVCKLFRDIRRYSEPEDGQGRELGGASPRGRPALSISQMQAHVYRQAGLLETCEGLQAAGSDDASPADTAQLEAEIRDMVRLAPQVWQPCLPYCAHDTHTGATQRAA